MHAIKGLSISEKTLELIKKSSVAWFVVGYFFCCLCYELSAHSSGDVGAFINFMEPLFLVSFLVYAVRETLRRYITHRDYFGWLSNLFIVLVVLAHLTFGFYISELRISARGHLLSHFPQLCPNSMPDQFTNVCGQFSINGGEAGLETYIYDPQRALLRPAAEWPPHIRDFFNIAGMSDADQCSIEWSKRVGLNIQYVSNRNCYNK
jgi:hypothetical protein